MIYEVLNPKGTVQGLIEKQYQTTDALLFKSIEAYVATEAPLSGFIGTVVLIPAVTVYREVDEYREAYENEADEDYRSEQEGCYFG